MQKRSFEIIPEASDESTAQIELELFVAVGLREDHVTPVTRQP